MDTTAATDSVRDLFLVLNQRRPSRFGRLGWLFTSPQAEHAFVKALAGEGAVAESDVLVRRITTWDGKDELQPGTPIFLLDRNPDSTRIMETELIYLGSGVAQRRNGELVRSVSSCRSERQARRFAGDFDHTHRRQHDRPFSVGLRGSGVHFLTDRSPDGPSVVYRESDVLAGRPWTGRAQAARPLA